LNTGHAKSRKKIIAITAVVMLPVLVLVLFLIPHHQSIVLPQLILQLRLTEEIRGEQAQEIIDAIHKQSVKPDENVVGIYSCTDGSAKLHVSLFNSRNIAEEQFNKMIALMELEKGSFSHIQELKIRNVTLYSSPGLGQSNYFFIYGKEYYWWSVDIQLAQASIQEMIRLVISEKYK
jgi:hypothetical protein